MTNEYEIGDIVSGKDISKKHGRYIYSCCLMCGYTRWISFRASATNQKHSQCSACVIKHQKNSWKVGRANVR
jgi:hypothetical protein